MGSLLLLLLLLPPLSHGLSIIVRLGLGLALRLYPYLYPYLWEWDGTMVSEVRIARGNQHLRNAWTEGSWQQNVDCLLLYRPRLVRDQTPNTRRPGSQEACQEGSIHTTHHLKSMLLASTKCSTVLCTLAVPSLSPGPSRPPVPSLARQSHAGQGVQKNFFPRWILIRRRGLVACQARANARRR